MSRMKTFRTYLILFLLFYLFVNCMSYLLVKSTYTNMDEYSIECENVSIKINEAKSSRISGYISGNIEYKNDSIYYSKYIKIDLISKTGNVITSKYVELDSSNKDIGQSFDIRFNAESIKSFAVYEVDEKDPEDAEFKTTILGVVSTVLVVLTAIKFVKWII